MSTKMNLDALRKERDQWETPDLGMDLKELAARYERLYTGAVNDVLRERCLTRQALPPGITALRDDMVVCGEAFTIRSNADPTTADELETRVRMLDALRPGCICLWNANGDDEASHWGGVMTGAAAQRGCRGAIIDGGIRDTREILQRRFPVWNRYRTSNGSLSRAKMTGFQVPIVVGGVIIKPGDILFADLDGVLVIPRAIAREVLERAESIRTNEVEIQEWVDAGLRAEEIHQKGGYF
jgi:4-hydroxy-4-methyl-2-oxoglutarate aldolase